MVASEVIRVFVGKWGLTDNEYELSFRGDINV